MPEGYRFIIETRNYYEVELDADNLDVLDDPSWYEILPREPFDADGPIWHVPHDNEVTSRVNAEEVERDVDFTDDGVVFRWRCGEHTGETVQQVVRAHLGLKEQSNDD